MSLAHPETGLNNKEIHETTLEMMPVQAKETLFSSRQSVIIGFVIYMLTDEKTFMISTMINRYDIQTTIIL